MDECIIYIKDEIPIRANQDSIVQAIIAGEITENRMKELELIWKKHKGHKRVLFIKESTLGINNVHELVTDRTVIKTLPNLPNDDDYFLSATDRDLDENQIHNDIKDFGLEFSHTPSTSKSAHHGPRKINFIPALIGSNDTSM